jgi:hypothetical protein
LDALAVLLAREGAGASILVHAWTGPFGLPPDRPAYDYWMARIPPENARTLGALGRESAADERDSNTRAVRKAMTLVDERLFGNCAAMPASNCRREPRPGRAAPSDGVADGRS